MGMSVGPRGCRQGGVGAEKVGEPWPMTPPTPGRMDPFEDTLRRLREAFSSGLTRPAEFRAAQLKALGCFLQDHRELLQQALAQDLHKVGGGQKGEGEGEGRQVGGGQEAGRQVGAWGQLHLHQVELKACPTPPPPLCQTCSSAFIRAFISSFTCLFIEHLLCARYCSRLRGSDRD